MGKTFKKNASALFVEQFTAEEPPEPKGPAQDQTEPRAAAEDHANGWQTKAEQPKSTRLQLLIQPYTKEALDKLARVQGVSRNELINQILKDYIKAKGNI